MTRFYILPCAGYDRPGGKITREIANIFGDEEFIVIGSIGALYNQRPGEMKDFRSSLVFCLDGCSTKCATKLANAHESESLKSFDIPRITQYVESEAEKINVVVSEIQTHIRDLKVKSTATEAKEEPMDETYFVEKIDKFTLVVKKNLYYSDNDFWVGVEDGKVRVGVTDLLQQMTSDIYFVELAKEGTRVEMFDEAGALESTKILLEILVPISGTIIEVNEELVDSPELVNEQPYEDGWIYTIIPDDLSQLELLKNAIEYFEYAVKKAKYEIGKKVAK